MNYVKNWLKWSGANRYRYIIKDATAKIFHVDSHINCLAKHMIGFHLSAVLGDVRNLLYVCFIAMTLSF